MTSSRRNRALKVFELMNESEELTEGGLGRCGFSEQWMGLPLLRNAPVGSTSEIGSGYGNCGAFLDRNASEGLPGGDGARTAWLPILMLVIGGPARQGFALEGVVTMHGVLNEGSDSRRWSSRSFMIILAA